MTSQGRGSAHEAGLVPSLELLKGRLFQQVQERRAGGRRNGDGLQGLFVSEEEVEDFLEAVLGKEGERPAGKGESLGLGSRLERLRQRFCLTALESSVLLLCLAPELDLGYERLFAYLQDDVTKKRPTVDLALRLFVPPEERLSARAAFQPGGTLVRWGLLRLEEDVLNQHGSFLAHFLRLDEGIREYLLGHDGLDARLLPFSRWVEPRRGLASVVLPPETRAYLERWSSAPWAEGTIFYFRGARGTGRKSTAEALCHLRSTSLLVLRAPGLLAAGSPEPLVRLAFRQARLAGTALYWEDFDAFLAEEAHPILAFFLSCLEEREGLTFLAGSRPWLPGGSLLARPFLPLEFPVPGAPARKELWDFYFGEQPSVDTGFLAERFRFTGGEIEDAVATARGLALWRSGDGGPLEEEVVALAAQLQAREKLGPLAHKVPLVYSWEDIVLPPDKLDQLREVASRVRHGSLVLGAWGFGEKQARGAGLSILFVGPSGTGKTMAAGIMARELGLELYRIDLSTLVSKYIGETEKNLDRAFQGARDSNAILFFDEADATFGKRSEVRDSHDRYANIEISYLLQRMEDYDGIVILATNLRRNMDEAFVRRMDFTVEFPFPGEAERLAIWKRAFPRGAPLAEDLDLALLAQRFKLTGGNIRNIALAAAFQAAAEGGPIAHRHLLAGARREFQKMGKLFLEEGASRRESVGSERER